MFLFLFLLFLHRAKQFSAFHHDNNNNNSNNNHYKHKPRARLSIGDSLKPILIHPKQENECVSLDVSRNLNLNLKLNPHSHLNLNLNQRPHSMIYLPVVLDLSLHYLLLLSTNYHDNIVNIENRIAKRQKIKDKRLQ